MSLSDESPLHDFPDRAIRKLLENPANLRDLIAAVLPDLVDRFDFSRREIVPRTFLLDDWRRRESDMLFRLPFLSADELPAALVCLLIEHQSKPEPPMPLRVLVYAALYWEQEWKAWEVRREDREPLRLTPIIPIVFHTGPTPWRTSRTLADLIGGPVEVRVYAPEWSPLFLDVAEHSAEEWLRSAGEWMAAMAVVRAERAEEEAFRAVFASVLGRLEGLSEQEQVRWHDLLWFVLSWALRRRPSRERDEIFAAAEGSQAAVSHQEEIRRMSETIVETWEQEMFNREQELSNKQQELLNRQQELLNRQQELLNRQQELFNSGQLNAYRENLRLLLEGRFGPLPEGLLQQIEAIDDLERLRGLFSQALSIASLAELLDLES
jgi:hypothetical protein